MNEKQKPITARGMSKVLEFLPVFEQNGYKFFVWGYGSLSYEDGTNVFPAPQYSEEVIRFIEILYEEGFIIQFDWRKWQGKVKQLCLETEALKKANLETIQKLLTSYIRGERFCEGLLARVLEDGYITAILHRLKDIRDGK